MTTDLTGLAEKSVLGAMLSAPKTIPDILEILKPSDFYHPRHEQIFKAICQTWEKTEVDAITVADTLSREGKLETVGGAPYLFEVLQSAPMGGTHIDHAKQISESATRRKLKAAGREIVQLAESSGDVDEILALSQEQLDKAQKLSAKDIHFVGDTLAETVEELADAMEGKPQTRGIESGFFELDEITNGFRGGQMIIVAARPGVGKSTLAVDIIRHASIRKHIPTLLFSLEMGDREIQQRILSAESEVHTQRLKKGNVTKEEWVRVTNAVNQVGESPILIDDSPNLTMLDIVAKTKTMVKRHGVKLVVIDYLQLISSAGTRESRQQEVSEISRKIKLLAKTCNIPIIAIAQLNRGVEQRGEGATPKPSDLRESGSLEQDADLILLIHRPELGDPDSARAGEADVIVGKHRGGPLGTVRVASQMHYSRFIDFPR